MTELYKMLVKKAKEQVKKEKATSLSADTFKLITLVVEMYYGINVDRKEEPDTIELPPVITAK